MTKISKDKIVGNFSIQRVIGSGAFGKVREGIHIPTGEKVAIKMLEKKRIKSEKDIQRIRKELQNLKKIRHPNILKLLQVKQTHHFIFIITEFVQGEQLYETIIKKGKLSLDQACRYFCQLFQAVKFLHLNKVAHRDIKPENIIVDGQNLKLIDFGLSIQWSQINNTMSTPCGSPCYAAPQMIKGKYDCRRVDIWAMGVTLYTMVAGKFPFEYENTSKLYKLIEKSQFEDVEGAPSYVNILLKAMIQKDHIKRISLQQIEENIWVKDKLKQLNLKQNQRLEWDREVLKQMQGVFKLSQKILMTQILQSQLSQMSTYYHLKMRRNAKKLKNQDGYHDGPFHVQFVFKNYKIIESFLEANCINYEWVLRQRQPQLNEQNDRPNNYRSTEKIRINGQQHRIRRLRNLPQLFYLPIENINQKKQSQINKYKKNLQKTADKSFYQADSSRQSKDIIV